MNFFREFFFQGPKKPELKKRFIAGALIGFLAAMPINAWAQNSFLTPGWVLDTENSTLEFQTTKTTQTNKVITESSTFATFDGSIDENGRATFSYFLDSVDTNVDLRNVRMRFLFFETFMFPYAQLTAQINPAHLAQLDQQRDITIVQPVLFSLHGFEVSKTITLRARMLDDNSVSISSLDPIVLTVAEFGLSDGLQKLEEAVTVTIEPQTKISLNLRFNKATSRAAFSQATAANVPVASTNTVVSAANPVEIASSVALETSGELSVEECQGRFEILSRTDNITFGTNLAALSRSSYPLLDSIVDIVSRCPSLTVIVAGHTDSVGQDDYNQGLSERRAASVVAYLLRNGVDIKNIQSVGYGEARPAYPNNSSSDRRRNRRIEFFSATN